VSKLGVIWVGTEHSAIYMFELKNNKKPRKSFSAIVKPQKADQQRIVIRCTKMTLDHKFLIFGDDSGNFWFQKLDFSKISSEVE
jgi:hypothetical protein